MTTASTVNNNFFFSLCPFFCCCFLLLKMCVFVYKRSRNVMPHAWNACMLLSHFFFLALSLLLFTRTRPLFKLYEIYYSLVFERTLSNWCPNAFRCSHTNIFCVYVRVNVYCKSCYLSNFLWQTSAKLCVFVCCCCCCWLRVLFTYYHVC